MRTRWFAIVTFVWGVVGAGFKGLEWWEHYDFLRDKVERHVPTWVRDAWTQLNTSPIASAVPAVWPVILMGIGVLFYLLDRRHPAVAPVQTPADAVLDHLDQGGLDRLPDMLERGEYLQRVLGQARELGVAAHYQAYKKTRRSEIVAWNDDLVRSLPTNVRAAERWVASPPPQLGSDVEAYLDERLTLLRRILA